MFNNHQLNLIVPECHVATIPYRTLVESQFSMSTIDKNKLDFAFLDGSATEQTRRFRSSSSEQRLRMDVLAKSFADSQQLIWTPSYNTTARMRQIIRRDSGVPRITHKGFQLLLQGIITFFFFLLQHLNVEFPVGMFAFFVLLLWLKRRTDGSSVTLTPTQVHLMDDLEMYWVMY